MVLYSFVYFTFSQLMACFDLEIYEQENYILYDKAPFCSHGSDLQRKNVIYRLFIQNLLILALLGSVYIAKELS